MAASPPWKVYDSSGSYQAACKDPAAAAALVSFYGGGATIRYGHSLVVWSEGPALDGTAGDSYDETAETLWARLDKHIKQAA